MKVNKRGLLIIGLFVALLLLSSLNVLGPLLSIVLASSWWTYIVVVAIIISGYMAFKHTKEDYKHEQEFIEKEGEVYMKRLAEEKERRKDLSS